ncbi:MAG: amino acid adenylation domain-containing protein [Actinomycetota bacterium]
MTLSPTEQPVSLRPRRRLGRSQARIWASQRVHPGVPLANMAKRTTIDGELDPDRFVAAFDSVVRAADALRGRIVEVDGVPRLDVASEPPRRTEVIDLPEADLDAWCDERISVPVDATSCAYDSVLLRHDDERWTWWLDLHHVVTDALGSSLVYEATSTAYSGGTLDLGSLREHLGALRRIEETDAWRTTRDEWKDRRRPAPPPTLYGPVDRSTTAVDRRRVGSPDLDARLDASLAGTYRTLSRELGLLAVLGTAVAELVHRLDGRDEIVLGIPIHQRHDRAAKRVVGPLMELFPLHVTVDEGDTHRSLHRRIARSIMRLLRDAEPGSSPDQDFSIVLNVLSARYDDFAGRPATTSWPRSGHADPAHLVRAQVTDYDGADLRIELDVNHAIGGVDQRRRLPDHLGGVLDRILDAPDEPIVATTIATAAEIDAVAAWRSPPATAAHADDVAHRVGTALRTVGADVAIEAGDRSLTGHQLDDLIGRVAAWFRREGLRVGDRVALRCERDIDAVALLHGALRAGVAFVPLDPADPVARHDRIVDDADIGLVLDGVPDDLPDEPLEPVVVDPDATAYVLYTSGSTGLPKGVPISRLGLDDYLTFAQAAYTDPGRPPTVALHSSLVFDLTITSLFVPFLAHGRLIVFGGDGPTALAAVAADPRIDWLKATPSQLERLVRMHDGDLPYRTLVVGGEAFRRPLARRLVERCHPEVAIHNEYGPTEAVVGCMIHRFDPELDTGPDVPIGAPTPGSEVLLLDAAGHPAPVGSWGELWVRRPGMAEAYLHRPELSAERFVELDGRRWYRTGDRARFERPGVAVYGGRSDDQLKVGGIRLEPGEVEAALATHPAVDNAVVRVWTPPQRSPSLIHRCPRCGLGDDVPDVTFDEHGVCSTCRTFDEVRPQAEAWFRTEDDLLERLRTARARRRGDIDAIHLLSGGKDSTYALYRLVEQGWNVHALTLDNGFISDGAKENIRRSIADLGITHDFLTTDAMNEIFRDSLDRHSNVCQGCFKTIYTLALHRARQLGAPVIVTGLSRGQFFETRLVPHQFSSGRFDPEAIDAAVLEARKAYHRTPDAVTEHLDQSIFDDDSIFDEVEFVDFYRYVDVDLSELYDFLEHRAPWVRPADTGRSTNCLVNIAGIHVHRTERGHHNYAEPYAWDVRLGHKTREEALEELDDEFDMSDVGRMLDEIGYEPQPSELLTAWYRSDAPIEPQDLRDHLRELVPGHAVPAAFVHVEDLPLAASAKIDVDALPAPTRFHRQSAEFRAPSTSVEQRLAAIWAEVLGLEQVGLDDDFFDIGGDSLAALEMITWAADQLAVDVPDASAFQRRTLAELARVFAAAGTAADREEPDPPVSDGPPPLSDGQVALRYDVRSDATSPRYTITRRHRVDGELDVERLRDALLAVVATQETLRWTFSEPRRELAPPQALEWSEVDSATDVDALAEQQARRRFDIEAGPLVRATVVRGPAGVTEILLSTHHLWCDARSFDLFWDHVATAYDGGEPVTPTVGYGTHALRLAHRLDEVTVAEAAAAVPAGAHSPVPAFTAPSAAEPDGYRRRAVELGAQPDRIVPTFLATVALALADDDRCVVGLPMTTRDVDVRESVGYFLNTVPVRLPVPVDGTFRQLVARVDDHLATAVDRRLVPFGELIAERRRRSMSTDLGSVMVVHDPPTDAVTVGDVALPGETIFNGAAITDLSLFVTETPTGAVIAAEWSGRRFRADDVDALLDRLAALLRAATDAPDASLDELAAPPIDRSPSVLVGAPLGDVPDSVLDEIWARRHDERAALAHEGDRLGYRALIERAEHLAAALADHGVGHGDLVGVSLHRRTDLVVALLGVMRLGAAYVPLDPSYPATRTAAILDSARPGLVVVDGSVTVPGVDTVDLDELLAADVDPTRLGPLPGPDAPAYVIHTSGSTGTPRGVLVRHRQLAASNTARQRHYGQDPERFLWTSSFGFDSSIVGLFWTLTTGGELVLPDGADGVDVRSLVRTIGDRRITHLLTVPGLWGAIEARLDPGLDTLQTVVVAGEACPTALVDAHHGRRPDVELWNEYGPTEATVWSSVHRCRPGQDPVPIGRPIPGAVLRVADALGRPVLDGALGELVIGGAGVTEGYLHDATATEERFTTDADGDRWYRSGDRARVGPDGLEFLGRVDDQLSLGGVRVEPAEIERVIGRHPQVSAVVVRIEPRLTADPADVLATLDPDDQRRILSAAGRADDPAAALVEAIASASGAPQVLVAHVEADELDESTLRAHAADALAPGLVPHRFVRHDRLPRTPHGKLDRRAVPRAPVAPNGSTSVTDPVVAAVVEVWREVFGFDDLGPDAEFLASGGDSLLALELVDAVLDRFAVDIDVASLLQRSTPSDMARLITAASPVLAAPDTDVVPAPSDGLVVTMRRGADAHPPVFVVPPAGGLLFTSQPLADALDQHTVLGLQYPGADGRGRPETDIASLARRFLPEVEAAQPSGPIRLVGASTGGLVAAELAELLAAAGRDVALVALVDTYTPGQRLGLWRARRDKYVDLIRSGRLTDVPAELRRKLVDRRRLSSIPPEADTRPIAPGSTVEVPRMLDIARRAEVAHRLAPTDLPIVLYAASGTNPARTVRGWRRAAPRLIVVELDGTHTGDEWIMGPARVERLVDDLVTRL